MSHAIAIPAVYIYAHNFLLQNSRVSYFGFMVIHSETILNHICFLKHYNTCSLLFIHFSLSILMYICDIILQLAKKTTETHMSLLITFWYNFLHASIKYNWYSPFTQFRLRGNVFIVIDQISSGNLFLWYEISS